MAFVFVGHSRMMSLIVSDRMRIRTYSEKGPMAEMDSYLPIAKQIKNPTIRLEWSLERISELRLQYGNNFSLPSYLKIKYNKNLINQNLKPS